MLSKFLIISLAVLGATATPTPTPTDTLSILAARGIDPSGPIPADATPLPNGGYSFAADSDAAHWSHAQSLTSITSLPKRASSGLSMTMWEHSNCGGGGAFFGNVEYGVRQVGPLTYYAAMQFNGRALLQSEQLDFSAINILNGDRCAFFVSTAARGHGPGCFSVSPYSCFRLLKH